jgi:hypothetical protein
MAHPFETPGRRVIGIRREIVGNMKEERLRAVLPDETQGFKGYEFSKIPAGFTTGMSPPGPMWW